MIILASNSITRANLLRNAGVEIEIISALIDEENISASMLNEGLKPRDIADGLADSKAQKISRKHSGWVLGADQVLDFKGEIYGKPKSLSNLKTQLINLSGQDHDIYSAAVIYKDGAPIWRYIGVARMSMRKLTPEFIDEYVVQNFDNVKSCAGGYQIESNGAQLFSKIQGDYFSILGLPLLQILDFLRQHRELKS